MRFGLSEQTIEKICGVFAKHSAIDKAVLYGSRAKGNFRPGSDIDLSLHGTGISLKELGKIDSEVDDLLLPYSVDLLIFDDLDHAKLRDHIERVGVIFYQRRNTTQDKAAFGAVGWYTEKLGEVCAFLNRGISPKYIEEGGVCVLNQKCIRDHRISYEQARRHDMEAKAVSDARFIQLGDVLVNSTGTGTLGRVAQVRELPPELTTVDSHVTIVRPKPNKFFPDFFGYMLIVIEEAIKEAGEGCGGQTELSRSVLADNFSVRFPASVSDQKRIANILDEAFGGIDAAKANAEENLQNARALFESHLQSIFTQRGHGWEYKSLSKIAKDFGRGKSKHRPRNEPKLYNGDYPFIQTGDISNAAHWITSYSQTYSEMGLAQSKLWPRGTVCIAIVGANVGETAILDFDACFPDSVIGIVTNDQLAVNEYVDYLLQSFKALLKEKGKGTARDNINLGTFDSQKFPFPKVDEQKKIVSILNKLADETQRLESIYQQKLAALDALKKSLLDQAFTGQL